LSEGARPQAGRATPDKERPPHFLKRKDGQDMTEFREEKTIEHLPALAVPNELAAAFPEYNEYISKGQLVLQRATDLQVTDAATMENAAIGREKIKEYMANIEGKRTFFVKPLNDHIHKINMLFKGLYDPFKAARDMLSDKLAKYEGVQRQLRANEERQRLAMLQEQKEAAKDTISISEVKKLDKQIEQQEKAVQAAATGKGTRKKTAAGTGVSFSSKLEITITDFAQVPDGYKELNEKKVRETYTSFAGKLDIPGLKLEMVPVTKTSSK
jgi:hypothetical protein